MDRIGGGGKAGRESRPCRGKEIWGEAFSRKKKIYCLLDCVGLYIFIVALRFCCNNNIVLVRIDFLFDIYNSIVLVRIDCLFLCFCFYSNLQIVSIAHAW